MSQTEFFTKFTICNTIEYLYLALVPMMRKTAVVPELIETLTGTMVRACMAQVKMFPQFCCHLRLHYQS